MAFVLLRVRLSNSNPEKGAGCKYNDMWRGPLRFQDFARKYDSHDTKCRLQEGVLELNL
jgi:hypothetical protein